MKSREALTRYLIEKKCATSSEIHDQLESLGFTRSLSMSILSKMVARGNVIRVGEFCRLNPHYNPDFPVKPVPVNTIFQECRSASKIREFDRLIRQVRGDDFCHEDEKQEELAHG